MFYPFHLLLSFPTLTYSRYQFSVYPGSLRYGGETGKVRTPFLSFSVFRSFLVWTRIVPLVSGGSLPSVRILLTPTTIRVDKSLLFWLPSPRSFQFPLLCYIGDSVVTRDSGIPNRSVSYSGSTRPSDVVTLPRTEDGDEKDVDRDLWGGDRCGSPLLSGGPSVCRPRTDVGI